MNNKAFTLVEIMIVVAIIGLLMAMAIPNFIKNREISQQSVCINNLRKIYDGKEQAALVRRWQPDLDCDLASNKVEINSYLKSDSTPFCPSGGVYVYGLLSTNPICTIESPRSHRLPMN